MISISNFLCLYSFAKLQLAIVVVAVAVPQTRRAPCFVSYFPEKYLFAKRYFNANFTFQYIFPYRCMYVCGYIVLIIISILNSNKN